MPRYRQPQRGLARIGPYWIARVPGSAALYRFHYDSAARRERRVSLRTTDLREAEALVTAHYLNEHRPQEAPPAEVLIEQVLLNYWTDHGQRCRSSHQIKLSLGRASAHFAGKPISALTPPELRAWVEALRASGLSLGTASRTVRDLRAALRWAYKQGLLASVPFIADPEDKADREAARQMGRPLALPELARLFDAAEGQGAQRPLYLMLLSCTLCRPEAALEAGPAQYDSEHQILHLNPPGRTQTKKHRPVVPVCRTLRPWLGLASPDQPRFILYPGEPIQKLRFGAIRTRAALPADVTAYSLRETMARELRARAVPPDQIELLLGHRLPAGHSGSSARYAPYDPAYCREAADTIDHIMGEVQALARSARITGPGASAPKLHPSRFGEGALSA